MMLLAFASVAEARSITFGYRPGGIVGAFLLEGMKIRQRGDSVVLSGHQASAAAIQSVWLQRNGVRICAKKGVKLFFHAGTLPSGKKIDVNRLILGHSIREGWYTPHKFQIKTCGVR
jgi:hypothetical protein